MARVSVKVTRKPRIDKVKQQYASNAKQLVGIAAGLVRATAVTSILQGAKSGVVYEKYEPRRTHTASAAGEPPASDTGRLASNIFIKMDTDRLGADVESRAGYSEFLEFGTTKMAARPFMHPAAEENRPKIRRLVQQMKAK